MKFFDEWNRRLSRWSEERLYLLMLAFMATLVAAVVTPFALEMHRNFMTIACDTAAFHSAVANTLNGDWFRDTVYAGPNLLGCAQHVMFVLLLVAPIYALFPSADTLFTLQICGVYSTVIPLYLVAVEMLRRPLVAFLIAGSALASPLLLQMALAPFHPESWVLAAVFWSYYFYCRNHATGFWLSVAFALSSGEQAAFIYVLWGLSLSLWDDGFAWRGRYGKFALAAGAGWLVLTMGVIAPLWHVPAQDNLMSYHYPDWHIDSVPGLAMAVLRDPAHALGLLLSPGRWAQVGGVVGPPLLLVFGFRRALIFLAPFPIYFLMSDQEFFLYFHAYYFAFAFFAGYLALILFLARWETLNRLGVTVLVATGFFNILLLSSVIALYGECTIGQDVQLNQQLHEQFDKIPTTAGVYAPHRYSAYLSNHPDMVMGDLADKNLDFDAMIDSKSDTTDVHHDQIDYIVTDLIDDQCGWRQGGDDPAKVQSRTDNIDRLLKGGQWQVYWALDNVVILRRAGK